MANPSDCVFCNLRSLIICSAFAGLLPFKRYCRCGKIPRHPDGLQVNWIICFITIIFDVSLLATVAYTIYTFPERKASLTDNSTMTSVLALTLLINSAVFSLLALYAQKDTVSIFNNISRLLDMLKEVAPWRNTERHIGADIYWRSRVYILVTICSLPAFVAVAISCDQKIEIIVSGIATISYSYTLFVTNAFICIHSCLLKNCYAEIIVSLKTAPARAAHRADLSRRRRKLIHVHKLVLENVKLFDEAHGFNILFFHVMVCAGTLLISYVPIKIMISGRIIEEFLLFIALIAIALIHGLIIFFTTSANEIAILIADDLLSFLNRYPITQVNKIEAHFLEAMMCCLNEKMILKPAGIITFSVKLVPRMLHSLLAYLLVALQFYQATLKKTQNDE